MTENDLSPLPGILKQGYEVSVLYLCLIQTVHPLCEQFTPVVIHENVDVALIFTA